MQAEAASLFLLENGDTEIVCRACAGPVDIVGMTLSPGEGIVGRTISLGLSQAIENAKDHPDFSKKIDVSTGFKTESIICSPLTIQGKTIGAMQVLNKRGAGLFANQDLTVLDALSSISALAIHNAREVNRRVVAESASQAKGEFLPI